jgi:hypothetical protein
MLYLNNPPIFNGTYVVSVPYVVSIYCHLREFRP